MTERMHVFMCIHVTVRLIAKEGKKERKILSVVFSACHRGLSSGAFQCLNSIRFRMCV